MIQRLLRKKPETVLEFPSWPRVSDLAAYCAGQGIPVKILHEAATQYRAASRTVPEQMLDMIVQGSKYAGKDASRWEAIRYARLYAGEYYPVPSVAVAEIEDALVYTPSGIIVTKDRQVLRDSTVTYDDFRSPPGNSDPENAPFLKGSHLSLLGLWDWNYAHWLMDCLPRLEVLEHCPVGTKILIRKNPQRFQKESLEMLGISPGLIVEVDSPFVRVEQMCAVRSSGITGIPHGGLLPKLRERLRKAAGIAASPDGRRLFISRSKTPSRSSSQRRILNQPEVEKILGAAGFETVHPETLSFAEQVRMFSGAAALAGAHGAGSYNLIFTPVGTPVLEFYNHAYWEHAACRISSLLGMPHYHLFSENADAERNFTVNVEHLEKLVAMATGNPGPEQIF